MKDHTVGGQVIDQALAEAVDRAWGEKSPKLISEKASRAAIDVVLEHLSEVSFAAMDDPGAQQGAYRETCQRIDDLLRAVNNTQ